MVGLRLARDRFGIVVRGVTEGGLVETWNAEQPALKVGFGDRIISVNGITVDSSLDGWRMAMSEFQKNIVHVVVQRNAWRSEVTGQSLQPQRASCLDRFLGEGFMDNLPRVCHDDCGASECPICLDQLQANSDIVQLPCWHAFHPECIEAWLVRCATSSRLAERRAECPTCRAQIPATKGTQAAEGRAAEVPEGWTAEVPEGSLPEAADGRATAASEGRFAEVSDGSDPEAAEGSGPEAAEGSDTEFAEGGFTEVARGSDPEAAEGSGSEAAEGSGSEAAEGSGPRAMEGSGPGAAEGSGPEAAVEESVAPVSEGGFTEAAEGSVPELAQSSGAEVAEGSDPEVGQDSVTEDYPLQASV